MIPELLNHYEVANGIADRIRSLRLRANLTQNALAKRSGVSLGSLKRFENSYEISLKNLIKLSMALGCISDLVNIFEHESANTLDDILKENSDKNNLRKRGRNNE